MRNKLTNGGYFLPLIFALLLTIVIGAYCTAQTPQDVFNYCDSIGIQHPDIVTKQAIKETGHFNCDNCSLDHNNLFGFQYKKKYLRFNTWQESCDYYLWWQNKHYQGQDYYDFLNCLWKHSDGTCARYATDPNYTNDLKSIEL